MDVFGFKVAGLPEGETVHSGYVPGSSALLVWAGSSAAIVRPDGRWIASWRDDAGREQTRTGESGHVVVGRLPAVFMPGRGGPEEGMDRR